MQRAAVSIGSNIAEGSAKPSNVEFAHYLDTALGSAYEVETQLLIANKKGYIDIDKYNELHSGQLQTACDLQYIKEEQLDALRPQFIEVAKMLSGLRNSLTVNL